MVRRTLVAAAAAVAATLLMVASASATIPPQGKVGPNQYFDGLVNGDNGQSSPAVIQMACFGPIRPGQTGHPMAGQTVEVLRPEVIVVGHTGFTGSSANRIVAFFGPQPSAATSSTVTFKHYGVAKTIPTSLVLPCAGSGTVSFVPMPRTAASPSRAATVPVNYEGQP